MFTGLVEKVGRLHAREGRAGGARLTIAFEPWTTPLALGESVAVQGVCLTATAVTDATCAFDVLEETLRKTSLGTLRVGGGLNLERALAAGDRFGGHIVSGHVDGVGEVAGLSRSDGGDLVIEVRCAAEMLRGMVPKGSIAVDGVSLTLVALRERSFTVHIIPWTESHTTLGERVAGDPVDLELDMIGKFVHRYLDQVLASRGAIGIDDLRRAGFVE